MRSETKPVPNADKAKLDFLDSMRHRVRTPLNSIIGFSELLKQRVAGDLNEKQEHYLDNILSNSKPLLDLINNVFDMIRIETQNMELITENFSVPAAIDIAIDQIKVKAVKRNVTLKKELDPQLDFIDADQIKFGQILYNLLDNAVKFSREEGGNVTITTKKLEDAAQFSVSDTGIGIGEKDLERLLSTYTNFDPGMSRKYEEQGLGLVISKYLVELHGGKIMAKRTPEGGSTFTFILPLKQKKVVK